MQITSSHSNMGMNTTSARKLAVCWILQCFASIFAYENLSFRRLAKQNSNFTSNKWSADRAVDGDRSAVLLGTNKDSCAVSNLHREVKWMVDLGEIKSIANIRIYYRTETVYETDYRGRFAGFSLFLSNTTDRKDWKFCFHEIQNGTNSPPPVFNTTCARHGRYFIYVNERQPNITYPSYYSTDAILELCEVEVYGCNASGVYGENCTLRCPQNCQERRCNIFSGECVGCVDGFLGKNCETLCDERKYGRNCAEVCSANCKDRPVCHHETGHCKFGCKDGFYGGQCQSPCSGNCLSGDFCNKTTGACDEGCAAGWKSSRCNKTCPVFTYGLNCEQACRACNDSKPCDPVTGKCANGYAEDQQKESCANSEAQTGSENSIIIGLVASVIILVIVCAVLIVFTVRLSRERTFLLQQQQYDTVRPSARDDNSYDVMNNITLKEENTKGSVRLDTDNVEAAYYNSPQTEYETVK